MGVLLLSTLPATQQNAAAAQWTEEDLASARRAGGATLDADGIGAPGHRDAPLSASLRGADTDAPTALVTFPSHQLDRRTGAVEIGVRATGGTGAFHVEARGRRSDGMWSEWRTATEATDNTHERVRLPAAAERVQVRVGIDSDTSGDRTRLTGVRLRPAGSGPTTPERQSLPSEAFSARLFATRIGLVGEETANGHRIRPDDHFVALPSRRGLAERGAGDYTARVCTDDTSRCVYAPVWDVGPWNTTDDHWNSDRERWPDLEQGIPQAQAAYQRGHNGGTDGSGRTVANPAGIDLADGTFREGLRLNDNAWVHTDFLWTGTYAHPAKVATARTPLVVRRAPATSAPEVGLAAHRATVDVSCRATGEPVTGPEGTPDTWYRIGEDHYVPASFVKGGESAPPCG